MEYDEYDVYTWGYLSEQEIRVNIENISSRPYLGGVTVWVYLYGDGREIDSSFAYEGTDVIFPKDSVRTGNITIKISNQQRIRGGLSYKGTIEW